MQPLHNIVQVTCKGNPMIQVTAIFNGSELSYGEGDTFQYAVEECMAGIDSMYTADSDTVRFIDLVQLGDKNLPKYINLNDVFYAPRQYF
jgi:hypothetical protein